MHNTVYWYNKLITDTEPLVHDMHVDVVIVGGGMSGLSAAQACAQRGLKVALLEKSFCGSGATGKSSGFITPDSEFSFADLVRIHGAPNAQKLWHFVQTGVEIIRSTIKQHAIACEYQVQDTLFVATDEHHFKYQLVQEHETRLKYGLESHLYNRKELKQLFTGKNYYGGVGYGNTFSIKAFDYCQALKKILVAQGVHIYENSPVTMVLPDGVTTARARVYAQKVIVAVDRFLPELAPFSYDIYHVQTFLMASAPLTDRQAEELFPHPVMAWDTDLLYHYFRLTPDHRLLLGGSDLFATYATESQPHKHRVFNELRKYADKYFPHIHLEWEYMWPGLIGITKDIFPLAGKDKNNPNIYYICAPTGLPWAAALGNYAVQDLYDRRTDMDQFFNPYRSYFVPHSVQALIGTRLSFAISHLKTSSSF